jgi:hypothetical protein
MEVQSIYMWQNKDSHFAYGHEKLWYTYCFGGRFDVWYKYFSVA